MATYSNVTDYLPGGAIFEQGLFAWEKALLDRPELLRRGRVLLAAAGGGRELKALSALGFEVVAFDQVELFCEHCRKALGTATRAQVFHAAYEDLADLARGGSGALAGLRGPFDLIWLGWGSFTHLTIVEDQVSVLASLKALAPHAPIVLSFLLHPPAPKRPGRLRRALRHILPYLGGQSTSWAIDFWPGGGFTYTFTETELRELFRAAGYLAAVFEAEPYAHALLFPAHAATTVLLSA